MFVSRSQSHFHVTTACFCIKYRNARLCHGETVARKTTTSDHVRSQTQLFTNWRKYKMVRAHGICFDFLLSQSMNFVTTAGVTTISVTVLCMRLG